MGSIEESKTGEAMLPEILHFRMERHTDDGVYYVISGVEIALVTDGATIEEAFTICAKPWKCILTAIICAAHQDCI